SGQRGRDRGDAADRQDARLVQVDGPGAGVTAGRDSAPRPRRRGPAVRRLVWAVAVSLLAAPIGAARATPGECEVPAELQQVDVTLPHLASRLAAKEPVTIVAIGGASTAGAAAGSPDLAYPARLRKAVARQSAQQMVERFPSDVLAEDPVLVVWESGTVDAVRDIQVDDYAGALQ